MGKIVVIEGTHYSGKSTTIKYYCENSNFKESKSVPDWFRQYIPYARSLDNFNQKKVYEIGHLAAYYDAKKSESNYMFDRWIFTTIIRLNFADKIPYEKTVEQILNLTIMPDLILILSASEQLIKERAILRDNNFDFNQEFYNYENNVFSTLKKDKRFVIINNEGNIIDTFETIDNVLSNKNIIEKGRVLKYEDK